MFTGIVEEIGKIRGIRHGEKSSIITISAFQVLDKTFVGDSICTNGVCLTVTKINKGSFEADVMAETLRRSNLANLKIGDHVNLERALTLDKRLGGHLDDHIFKVSIIPHTGEHTTLLDKLQGETVNLECDQLGKYVEKLLGLQKQENIGGSKINEDFLKINGFI